MPHPPHDPAGLAWLDATLDACRHEIRQRRTHPDGQPRPLTQWTKTTITHREEIVSELDLALEHALICRIRTVYPAARILAEETSPDIGALTAPVGFVVDPIDGTKELLAGRRGYAISVAKLQHRRVVAALLDFPAYGWRFTAGVGRGTYLNSQRVRLADTATLADARIAVSPAQHRASRFQPFWEHLGATELTPVGALTPKVAEVLHDRCDAALYLPVAGSVAAVWDYAAAALLLEEAGGRFTDLTGHRLLTSMPLRHDGGWAAAAPKLHAQLLDRQRNLPRPSATQAAADPYGQGPRSTMSG